MVADMRTDLRGQLALTNQIGSGFGAFFGGMAGDKIRQQKEYEKLYLEAANERFISTLSLGSAEGWDKQTMHSALMEIPKWAQTTAGERYAFNLQRDSVRQKADGLMEQHGFWSKDLANALETTSLDDPEQDPRVIRARTQIANVTNLIAGQDEKVDAEIAEEIVGPPEPQYDAGYYDRNTPLDEKIKHKVSYATSEPDKAADSYRQAIKKLGGTDKDLEDLKRVFREGNEQKIAEAIRRMIK